MLPLSSLADALSFVPPPLRPPLFFLLRCYLVSLFVLEKTTFFLLFGIRPSVASPPLALLPSPCNVPFPNSCFPADIFFYFFRFGSAGLDTFPEVSSRLSLPYTLVSVFSPGQWSALGSGECTPSPLLFSMRSASQPYAPPKTCKFFSFYHATPLYPRDFFHLHVFRLFPSRWLRFPLTESFPAEFSPSFQTWIPFSFLIGLFGGGFVFSRFALFF